MQGLWRAIARFEFPSDLFPLTSAFYKIQNNPARRVNMLLSLVQLLDKDKID